LAIVAGMKKSYDHAEQKSRTLEKKHVDKRILYTNTKLKRVYP